MRWERDLTDQEQVVNYLILTELINGNRDINSILSKIETIQDLPFKISKDKIQRKILRAEQDGALPIPAVLINKLSHRHGKDKMYAELWRLVSLVLDQPYSYCGLPAHQVLSLRNKLSKGDSCTAVERDASTFSWMKSAIRWAALNIPEDKVSVQVIQGDILKLFPLWKNINILDLDLMITLSSLREAFNNSFWELAGLIYDSTADKTVINITTSIGRAITTATYNKLIEEMDNEFRLLYPNKKYRRFSGGYRDNKVPMRYEHIYLQKYLSK